MDNYNALYEKDNYYGKPYELTTNFFERLEQRGKLLDLGCGQGRNAIMLAKHGYEVTGVDNSEKGLECLKKAAEAEKLNIKAINCDAYDYDGYQEYDIIFADAFFKFLKKDLEKETGLLNRILDKLKKGGVFCNCMKNSSRSLENFTDIFMEHPSAFEILYDNVAQYPELNELRHVFIIQKM